MGDGVAVVVAESAAAARDAMEAVVVDYAELPATFELEDALGDSTLAHPDLGTNTAYVWELKPDEDLVDHAFADAVHTVNERYVHQRLIPMAMEPRGVCIVPEPYGGDVTIYSSTQIPHILKIQLAVMLGLAEHQVRVVAPVGRWRLRVEAQRLRGRGDLPRDRQAAEAPRPLDRGAHARTRRPRCTVAG